MVQRRVDAPAFTIHDLEMLAALAEGVGQILPRSRAQSLTAGTSWLEQDMAAAGVLQRTFLPDSLGENSAGVRVVAEYMPAYAVGGDFTTSWTLETAGSWGSSATSPARA